MPELRFFVIQTITTSKDPFIYHVWKRSGYVHVKVPSGYTQETDCTTLNYLLNLHNSNTFKLPFTQNKSVVKNKMLHPIMPIALLLCNRLVLIFSQSWTVSYLRCVLGPFVLCFSRVLDEMKTSQDTTLETRKSLAVKVWMTSVRQLLYSGSSDSVPENIPQVPLRIHAVPESTSSVITSSCLGFTVR